MLTFFPRNMVIRIFMLPIPPVLSLDLRKDESRSRFKE